MTNSEKDALKKDLQADTFEDEIDLMDYFGILWKRKWFILLASILPAAIVGLVMFFSPRSQTLTFMYNQELGEKSLRTLEGMFYSEENISKLVAKLQTAGFDNVAQGLANARNRENLKNTVSFEVSPSFLLAKPEGAESFEEAQQLKQEKGSLLSVCITLNSEKDIRKAALIFRKNIEKIIPLYSEKEHLNQNVIVFKDKMADIEVARYTLNLGLERKKSTLEKFNKLSSNGLDKLPSDNIVLQFNDINSSGDYLPLSYQRQAAETQIINIEEQIRANSEMYNYYADLLKLSKKLFSYANKAIASDSTLEQFCSSLIGTLAEYKDNAQVADYLNAYIKRVENKVASNMPITEKPELYPVAKGTVKKSGIVFVTAFMLSVFAAFLRESIEKRKLQIS